jgi:hypothetical protein
MMWGKCTRDTEEGQPRTARTKGQQRKVRSGRSGAALNVAAALGRRGWLLQSVTCQRCDALSICASLYALNNLYDSMYLQDSGAVLRVS